MNAIFCYVFILATALLIAQNPENFLSAVLSGATKAGSLCIALLASYALWLGLISLWEASGLNKKISKFLKPVAKRLFKTQDDEALDTVCMNLSVNLLGIGGAATPYGIKAANLLDKTPNAEYSSAMLFVINATSIQLIPTAIVGVRTSLGSLAAADIILPSLLSTVFSTGLGILLTWLFFKIRGGIKIKPLARFDKKGEKFTKRVGAGTR